MPAATPWTPCKRRVVRIGLDRIRQTVLNVSVVERFSAVAFDESLNTSQFWEHAIGCGIIAAEIAHGTTQKGTDAAFTMGLLHDVGRIVFAEQLGEQYVPVLAAARSLALPLEQVETRMLLLNHADVMDKLLRGWNFPHHLISPILLHHYSVGGMRASAPHQMNEALSLSLANRLAHALLLGSSGNDTIYPTEELCEALHIGAKLINHIETIAGQQTDEMKFAMLTQSSAPMWPRPADQIRSQLRVPFRPLYISAQPELDACRIFCSTLAGPMTDDPPNIAVLHAPRTPDQLPLITKLRKAEQDAGARGLPILLLSQPGQAGFDSSLVSDRTCQRLVTPFAVSRFVAAVNNAVERDKSEQGQRAA